MKEQYRQIVRQKIVDGLVAPIPALTRRDVWMPSVPRKATAVIGMRRTGKTTLLWQVLADRLDHTAQTAKSEGLGGVGAERT
jgi:predicted AAA+ superfamily ATPase